MSKPKVLILLADCPAYFVELMFQAGKQLREQGIEIVFACTTPYYEHYKAIRLGELGQTYYLSEYTPTSNNMVGKDLEIDWWKAYPTYVRDRHFKGNHRNQWQTYSHVATFFHEILDKERPLLIVSEPPSNSFLYMAFEAAHKRNISYFGYMSARVPKHFNIFLDEFGLCLLKNNSQALDIIEGPPDYMQDHNITVAESKLLSKVWRMFTAPPHKSIEVGDARIHQIQAYWKRLVRLGRAKNSERARVFEQDIHFDNNTPTVLFPLQLRPEASTSVLARYYENDLEVIKNIAFSLPSGSRLIVKEHMAAVGTRSLKFYRDVLSLPNTILLHPNYPLLDNIKKFTAVVVLTSTVGFEALQMGVPVFVLGNVFYVNYPEAVSVNSFTELEGHLRTLKTRKNIPNPQILQRYSQYCFPGQFNYRNAQVINPTNIADLMRPVVQFVTESSKNERISTQITHDN